MDTPVLLITFNRPDLTRAAVDRLLASGARNIYVAQDGPRETFPDDTAKCAAVREIIGELEQVSGTRFLIREENLGCQLGVGTAIDWFFEHEEEGIILEDDIDADPSFFPYAAELLERCRDDERIAIIAASNLASGEPATDGSYLFTRNFHIWGWATWRRAWALVDYRISDWSAHPHARFLTETYGEPWWVRQAWERTFDATATGRIDTWDYGVMHSFWKLGKFAITPAVNMIANEGYGADATHTIEDTPPDYLTLNPRSQMPFPLRHPAEVRRDHETDRKLDREVFHISMARSLRNAPKLPLRRLRRRLGIGRP